MDKKAFTLIELLVTIAIIGLLATIVLPVFGRARALAIRAQCANNLRQIGVAWHLYLDDHDWIITADANEWGWGGKKGLLASGVPASDRVLNPYLDAHSDSDTAALEVFHCPGDKYKIAILSDNTFFDYCGNSYYVAQNLKSKSLPSSKVPYSKLQLVRDSPSGPNSCHGGSYPHFKINVLFLDGHIEMRDFDADWLIGGGSKVYISPDGDI